MEVYPAGELAIIKDHNNFEPPVDWNHALLPKHPSKFKIEKGKRNKVKRAISPGPDEIR